MRGALLGHSMVLGDTLALASMVALAGCGHEAPLGPPPVAPVLADVAPVTAEPPIAEPLPLSDAPAVLASICTPIWAIHEDGSRRIACTTHGPYATVARPSSEISTHEGDPLEVCELASIARGAYTKAGAKEMLLAFEPCKDRGRAPTAFLVVVSEDESRSYKPAGFLNDVRLERCEKTRRADGVDIFYCESTKRLPQVGASTSYAVVDFARSGSHYGNLVTLMQHDFDCARFQTTNTMAKGYVWMRPPTFRTDAGKLVIEVERTFAPPSPTLDGQLGAECQKQSDTDGLAALPPPRKESLTVEPTASLYALAHASQVLVSQWSRELNDYRLRSAVPSLTSVKK